MSLASQLSALATRVGVENKAIRTLANGKYTKPGGGIPLTDLDSTALSKVNRWEQEILVQSGVRVTGNGPAPKGIHIPYAINLKGVSYQFETATTTGATTGFIVFNTNVNNLSSSVELNMAAGSIVQTITGVNIAVPAGSRLAFYIWNVGTAGVGKGLSMSLWGEYQ